MNAASRTSRLARTLRDFAEGVNTAHAIRHGNHNHPTPAHSTTPTPAHEPAPAPGSVPQPARRSVSEYQFPLGSRKIASTP